MNCNHGPLIEALAVWSQAYPLDVFPEPPPAEHGSVSTCSARMGRHVIEALLKYVSEADLLEYGIQVTHPEYQIVD